VERTLSYNMVDRNRVVTPATNDKITTFVMFSLGVSCVFSARVAMGGRSMISTKNVPITVMTTAATRGVLSSLDPPPFRIFNMREMLLFTGDEVETGVLVGGKLSIQFEDIYIMGCKKMFAVRWLGTVLTKPRKFVHYQTTAKHCMFGVFVFSAAVQTSARMVGSEEALRVVSFH